MLKAAIVEPEQSEWASPVLLVPKPYGSMRFCIEYRKLNTVTIKDKYPTSRIDECIESSGKANIVTALDAN